MKTIIKLLIAFALITSCFNVGRTLLGVYQFEDAVRESLLFDPRMTDKEIVEAVMQAAAEYSIPIEPDGVNVRQIGPDVRVEMTYTTDVVLIPGVVSKTWTFNPSASTRLLTGNRRQPS